MNFIVEYTKEQLIDKTLYKASLSNNEWNQLYIWDEELTHNVVKITSWIRSHVDIWMNAFLIIDFYLHIRALGL